MMDLQLTGINAKCMVLGKCVDFSPKLEDFVRIVVLSVRNNYRFVTPVLLAVLIYLEIDTIYREETDS
jgi:hypothetical protein